MIYCKICRSPVEKIGDKKGIQDGRSYTLYRCLNCYFSFVNNPCKDYNNIYSEAYYRGTSIDPLVNYVYELENPDTSIRIYEWKGILDVVKSLYSKPLSTKVNWLDYGCGNGGLVRYVRKKTNCKIIGYDKGWIVDKAIQLRIPITRSKKQLKSIKYNIITAIEVLEHVDNPLDILREIKSMLVSGGLFFYTTDNAQTHRTNLLNWNYFSPEIHISLYEPYTMKVA